MARRNKVEAVIETRYKDKGTKALKQDLKEQNKALNDLKETLKDVGGSNKNLDNTIKKFTESLKNSNKKLDENNNKLKKMGSSSKEADTGMSKLTGAISNFNTAIKGFLALKVTQYILSIGNAAITASSNMEELQNVTDQVFENLSEDIQKFAEQTSAAMGRSIYDLKKYTSDMGSILKGLGGFDNNTIKEMSQNLAALAVDIGSFKNISDEEAFNALRGGIVGETESLKRLGIVLNDTTMAEYARSKGLKESWQNLDASIKAQLRYEKLLESTKFMQGDAARTINSYANQLKVAQANIDNLAVVIGDKLKNSATGFLNIFNKLTSAIYDWSTKKSANDYILDFVTQKNEFTKLANTYKSLSKEKVESGLSNEKEQERLNIYQQMIDKYPQIKDIISKEAKDWSKVSKAIDKVTKSLQDKMSEEIKQNLITDIQKIIQETDGELQRKKDLINKSVNELEIATGSGKFANNLLNNNELVNKISQLSENIKTAQGEGAVDRIYNEIDKLLQNVDGYNSSIKDKIGQIAYLSEQHSALVKGYTELNEEQSEKIKLKINETNKKIQQTKEATDRLIANDDGTYTYLNNIDDDVKNLQELQRQDILDSKGEIVRTVIDAKIAIMKSMTGFVTSISGANNTLYKIEKKDGKYTASTGSGVNEKKYTFSNEQNALDFIREQTNAYSNFFKTHLKRVEDKPKDGNNRHGSKGGSAKEIKNKYEQLIENLDTLNKELSTVATPEQKSKILSLAANIRHTQIENIKALEAIGAISLSESLQEQIKALEQELEKAKELKDKATIDNLKGKINDLLVNNVLASAVDNIIKELENNTNISSSKALDIDETQKGKVYENIAKFQESNLYLEEQLKNGLITQEGYLKQKIENSNLVIKAYQTIGDLDKAFIEKLNQIELDLNKITLNYNQNKMLNVLDNILNGGNIYQQEELLKKSLDEYYISLNKTLQDLVKKLSTEKGWDIEKFKKVYSATNEQLDEMIKTAEVEGDKATQEIAKLMQTIKGVSAEKNKKNFNQKFMDVNSDIIKGLQALNGAFGGALDVVINFANNLQNIASGISNISTNGFSFSALGGIFGGVINIVSGFLGALFHKDEGAIKAKREYEKDVNKWNEELPKSLDVLRNSTDNLATEMKNFTKILIKNIASNTSNSNILKNQHIATELAKEYANSFDAVVKSTISRTKHSYRWWGLSNDTQYLGTENKEESLRKILGIPEFKSAEDIRKWYELNKNKKYNPEFEKLGSNSGFLGFSGYSHEEKLVGTNFKEVLDIIPVFADNVERIMSYSKETARYGVYESLEGINVTSTGELKDQLRNILKKLVESSGQDWSTVATKIESRLNDLVKEDEVIVQAFDDVRGNLTSHLAQGHEILDSLADGLQGYFNKIRTNLSKIMYDLQFRDNNDFEKSFVDKFKQISDALVKLRLENGKTIKDLDKSTLNFRDLFKQLKEMDKITNDTRDIIAEIRRQAKEQGLSDEIIDKMLPLDKVSERSKQISDMLKTAMFAAIDTNSFDQFSMSIGDSLYKFAKEGLIQAFVESEKFKELYSKYTDLDATKERLDKANTIKEAYDIIQGNLLNYENRLKSEGLSFRETNASNGEYLGGFSNGSSDITNNSSISKGNINVTVHTEIQNSGFLSSQEVVNGIAEQVKAKIEESYRREV